MTLATAPFRETFFPSAEMRVEKREDGTLVLRPVLPLDDYPPHVPGELIRWSAKIPDQTYLAERASPGGPWRHHSYAATKRDADAIAQWLLDREIDSGRSLLILSGNSIAHAVMKYGAMAAHVPVCPVSVNYALMGGDYGRLRHVINLVRPAVVFADSAETYRRALDTVDFKDAVIVTDDPSVLTRPAIAFEDVLKTNVTPAVAASIASIDPDDTVAYMMTSGSTSLPKAVIHTHRMTSANLAQARQILGQTAGWNDVMLDWLPWNHVSGAFTKMGVLTSGGTLYIDGGRPMPGRFEETIANIKEVPPIFFVNVPVGYAMLADALDRDDELRERFFSRLRLALYGGAGLPQALYDRLQALAIRTTGHRVFFTSGYGTTESTSGCMAIYFPTDKVGIGLPMPGLEVKLIPRENRYEIRMRGPMITPGYLSGESATRDLFDEEGFYRTGDTAEFHDPDDVSKGLRFAGRLAEDFKLSNGTWVSAGTLRAELIEACSPALTELLVCGENRDSVRVLAWISVAGCRSIVVAQDASDTTAEPAQLRAHPAVRAFLAQRLTQFNAKRGSSARVVRLALLAEPPSVDHHEVSDKGSVNQRVALDRRQDDVERLYADPPATDVVVPSPPTASRS